MSEIQPKVASFLELYRGGQVTARQIEDYIGAWHNSDKSEHRPLPEYLGMSDDEYTVWMASRQALPAIIAARETGRPLVALVAEHLAELLAAARAKDRAAIYVLSHWLAERMGS